MDDNIAKAVVARMLRLESALLWIDTHDPEIVSAAEKKFGFVLERRDEEVAAAVNAANAIGRA